MRHGNATKFICTECREKFTTREHPLRGVPYAERAIYCSKTCMDARAVRLALEGMRDEPG